MTGKHCAKTTFCRRPTVVVGQKFPAKIVPSIHHYARNQYNTRYVACNIF